MSFKALNWAEDVTTGSPVCKSVLMWLANYADEAHSCYPKVTTLVKVSEFKRSAVCEAIKKLNAAGLIKTLARYDNKGARIQNRYLLMVDGPITSMPALGDWTDEQTYTAPRKRAALTAAQAEPDDDEYEDRPDPDGRPVPPHVDGWPVTVDSAETQPLDTPPPPRGHPPVQDADGGHPPRGRGPVQHADGGHPPRGRGPVQHADGPPPADGGGPVRHADGFYKEEPSVEPPVEPPGGTVETPPPPPPVAHPGSNPEEEDPTMIDKVLDDALRADADAVLAAVTRGLPDAHRPGPAQTDELRTLTMGALRAGWTRGPLVARLRAGNIADAHSGVFAVLRYRLGDLPDLHGTPRPATAGLPSVWCGAPSCDPVTRQLLDVEGRPTVRHDSESGRRFALMCPTCGTAR